VSVEPAGLINGWSSNEMRGMLFYDAAAYRDRIANEAEVIAHLVARRLSLIGLLALVGLLRPGSARASVETAYFEHEDERYLYPSQRHGGVALVPAGTPGRRLPLLVFLHGSNPAQALHFWMGGGGRDLRPVVGQLLASKRVKPFIFAGPSQTKAAAHGRNLWTHFDLDRFVGDVERGLDGRAIVDPDSVIEMGP
jgi:hypothetical protein